MCTCLLTIMMILDVLILCGLRKREDLLLEFFQALGTSVLILIQLV